MLLKKKELKKVFFNKEEYEISRHEHNWKSKNGNVKLIQELDLNHLKNIIKKIKRGELEKRQSMESTLIKELHYREQFLNKDKNE